MTVIFYDTVLDAVLNDPQGLVGLDLARRLQRAVNAAKVNASGRPGPNVVTGRLRASIAFQLGRDAKGLFGDYGTNVKYGLYLETGLRNGATYPFLVPAMEALR